MSLRVTRTPFVIPTQNTVAYPHTKADLRFWRGSFHVDVHHPWFLTPTTDPGLRVSPIFNLLLSIPKVFCGRLIQAIETRHAWIWDSNVFSVWLIFFDPNCPLTTAEKRFSLRTSFNSTAVWPLNGKFLLQQRPRAKKSFANQLLVWFVIVSSSPGITRCRCVPPADWSYCLFPSFVFKRTEKPRGD